MQNTCEHADHLRTKPKRRHGFRFDAEAYEAKLAAARLKREQQSLADMDAMPAHFGLCYFVGNLEAGLVKIGFSRQLSTRMNRLRGQALFPLSVLATINGAADRERYYHDKFAASRFSGEWFEITPGILAEIEAINGRQNQNGPEMRSNAPRPCTR